MRQRLLGRLLSGLLAGVWVWPTFNAYGSWISPRAIPMVRPGKTGISAAKRRARKARNFRRSRYGRA